MTSENKLIHKMSLLVNASLNGTITEDEFVELKELIRNVPEACEYYIDIMWTYVGMNSIYGISGLGDSAVALESKEFIEAMLEEEVMAPAVEIPKECHTDIAQQDNLQANEYKLKKAYKIYSMVVSSVAVLMILFIVYVNMFPAKLTVPVGTVVEQIDVQWSKSSEHLNVQDRLLTNQAPYCINKGLIKITYDHGVDVIIEGPAVFSCKNSQSIHLLSGKAYTCVPRPAIGFTVFTPACDVIDLGTEFGTYVQQDGNTVVQMYKGKASLVSWAQDQSHDDVILCQNEARRIEMSTGTISSIETDPLAFVRYIDPETKEYWNGRAFDLSDVVGSGNGFGTGVVGGGINPETGSFNSRYVRYGRGHIAKNASWSPVQSNPFVDSVFVADGSEGPQRISSDGQLFEFGETDRRFHHDVFYSASGKTMLPADEYLESPDPVQEEYSEIAIDGIEYGVKAHPAIFIHAPSGITFDLASIRQNLSGLEMCSFRAVFDIPETGRDGSNLDVVILVDGECVFEERNYTVNDPSVEIEIPISVNCQYLTLAVTDGGDGAWWDLCAFREPRLELTNK